MGIERIAALLGIHLPSKTMGKLFEQFVGLELLRSLRLLAPSIKLRYWHDHNGPEIDYVFCRCDKPLYLEKNIIAMPWQTIGQVVNDYIMPQMLLT